MTKREWVAVLALPPAVGLVALLFLVALAALLDAQIVDPVAPLHGPRGLYDQCLEYEREHYATECMLKVAVGRVQTQVNELQKVDIDYLRLLRELTELTKRVEALEKTHEVTK